MSGWDPVAAGGADGIDWTTGAVAIGEQASDFSKPSRTTDNFASSDSGWNNPAADNTQGYNSSKFGDSSSRYGDSSNKYGDSSSRYGENGGGGGGGRGGGAPREGDWDCPSCGNSNFATRFKCRDCGTANPNASSGGGGGGGPREGDWDCPSCGNSNFASRFKCRDCGAQNPNGGGFGGGGGGYSGGGGGDRPPREARPGDWNCPSCNVSNFASRSMCFKCSAEKPEGAGDSGGRSYGNGGGFGGGFGGGPGGDDKKGMRPGDWQCPSCGFSNFASRFECNKCNLAKPENVPNGGAPVGPVARAPRAGEDPSKPHEWASSRRRYEWKVEYEANADPEIGLVAPPDKELELELFGEENHINTGLHFDKYQKINVSVKGEGPPPISTFDEAKLHPVMKENVRMAKYSVPTPVQRYSIPIITEGRDLMACAQTGSGKTAAFLVPILSNLFGKAKQLSAGKSRPAQPLVLIMAPTRELCGQIFDECRRFTYRSMLRPCAIYGGAESFGQRNELSRGCDILAATPGRLADFLERKFVSLRRIKYLVLDEADRMLEMGFEEKIREVVEQSDMPKDRQTLMYSATFPRLIRSLAKDFLSKSFLFLKVGRVGGTSEAITQTVKFVEEQNKRAELMNLLLSQPPSRTLVFVETKRSADSLDDFLYANSFPSTSIHGDRTQREREDALLAFKSGRCPILVATGVAARGLDIRSVMHVINYDLCNELDEYIHRIGRTARVGNDGLATSFYNDKNQQLAPELTKLLIECNQEVPSFLQAYKTDNIVFDEDLDDEAESAPNAAAPAWGGNNTRAWGSTEKNMGASMQDNTSAHSGGGGGGWNTPSATPAVKGDTWGSGSAAPVNDSWGGGSTTTAAPAWGGG